MDQFLLNRIPSIIEKFKVSQHNQTQPNYSFFVIKRHGTKRFPNQPHNLINLLIYLPYMINAKI